MTTPLSSDGPGAARPANPGADSPTENMSTHPTRPYPRADIPPEDNDTTPNFFAPNFFAPNSGIPTATPATPAAAPRLRPRFGTILWGILLLAFATYMVVFTLLPVPPDPTLWLLGGVIAVGLGLVVAGIAAAACRAD